MIATYDSCFGIVLREIWHDCETSRSSLLFVLFYAFYHGATEMHAVNLFLKASRKNRAE